MLFATTGEFAGALSAFGASNGVEFVAIVPLTWRRRAKNRLRAYAKTNSITKS